MKRCSLLITGPQSVTCAIALQGRSYNIRFSTSPSPAPSPMPALALAQPADRDAGQVDLNMPVEVMLRMLQFLSPESLGALRRVCKSWRILINHHDRELFKPSCLERKWLVPIKPVDAANTGNAAIEDTGCLPGVLPVTPVRSSEGAGSPSGSERMVTPRGHWISVFASNYNCKKGFWNGKLADFCNSPYHDGKKLHMNFGVMDWGENLENALAAGYTATQTPS